MIDCSTSRTTPYALRTTRIFRCPTLQRFHASALPPRPQDAVAPNKANLRCFWPENEGRAKKQTQSAAGVRPAFHLHRGQDARDTRRRDAFDTEDRNVPNKPNLWAQTCKTKPIPARFWLENEGRARKQSQFGGARMPNKANFPPLGERREDQHAGQSQFGPGEKESEWRAHFGGGDTL
jgi:hypothetical protein